jgi:CDP-glucose 4,6-dehydratase
MDHNRVCPNFWASKKVMITGHTGFKGSWLTLWLKSLGADICGLSLEAPTTPSLFAQANVSDGIRHEIQDVRDFEGVASVFNSFKPEIVIHMAAQPLVRLSYETPIETYATNVMGTVHVLEASRRARSVKAIVNVTTDKCYENREWIWGYRENEAMGGRDPYSSSKGCAEIVSSAYARSFFENDGIGLATARAGNVIGGGDWAKDRLIPDLLNDLARGSALRVRNPNATRPWQHVLEPLSGYLILAQKLYDGKSDFSGGWNFGPTDDGERTVGWIAETLAAKWGVAPQLVSQSGEHPHEANFLKLDISKAKQQLGWQPSWSLDTALDKIVTWHKALIAKHDLQELCTRQIHEYNSQGMKS